LCFGDGVARIDLIQGSIRSGMNSEVTSREYMVPQTSWVYRNPRQASALLAFLSFFPLTAVFHHAVFFRPTCILNNFGAEYTPSVIAIWLSLDPSPYVALIGTLLVFVAAVRYPILRLAVLAFVIAMIPLTLWIWDIPFSGRIVCDWGHDGRSPINSLDLYIFAAISFAPIWYWLWRNSTAAPTPTADALSR
jgi:hypothetical protein